MMADEEQLARRFQASLVERWGPALAQVTVFGSRARGTARRDSDLDVLVLMNGSLPRATRDQIYDLAYDLSAATEFRIPLAPLVMTVPAFEELVARERRLALDICREGVSL